MKVVLRTDVPGVGKRGDIAEVSDGFARNYLVPQGRAIFANAGIEDQAASMRRSRDVKDAVTVREPRRSPASSSPSCSGSNRVLARRAGCSVPSPPLTSSRR